MKGDPLLARVQEDAAPGRYDYAFLRAVSNTMGEKNDCTVVCVAAVTATPYTIVHSMMKKMGRRDRCSTGNHITKAVIGQLGFRLFDVSRSFNGRTIRAVAPSLHHEKRYIIWSSRHVSAVIGGKVEDWADERGLFVQAITQVLEMHEPDPDIQIAAPPPMGRWHAVAHGAKAREMVRDEAEYHLKHRLREMGLSTAPRSRRWWLGLRAKIMTTLEMYEIKRTTASVELGLWQVEIGYDMKTLS